VMAWFEIFYRCPCCHHEWTDTWSSLVDAECPECGVSDITPIDAEDMEEPE
jgi:peptide subunit release factor 1 (eRF1)